MTYQHITIKRIPVALELAMDDGHNAEVSREEDLARAAPALAEALRDMVRAQESGTMYASICNNARAALAKAGVHL